MPEKHHWEKVVASFLKQLSFFNYYWTDNPGNYISLLAKIDVERAIEHGYRTPDEIIDFLSITEEGWFFEKRAKIAEIINEVSKL